MDSVKVLESKVDQMLELWKDVEDERWLVEEMEQKIKVAIDKIKHAKSNDVDTAILAAYELGKLLGKASMANKIAKISKIIMTVQTKG